MSCKGAIKKTRSINADSDTLGMEGNVIERRTSTVAPNWSDPTKQSTTGSSATPTTSSRPDDDSTPKIQIKNKYEGKKNTAV